jgi:hypothetical protein
MFPKQRLIWLRKSTDLLYAHLALISASQFGNLETVIIFVIRKNENKKRRG